MISTFGERLIVPLFSAVLQQAGIRAEAFDARGLIVTNEEADFARVDFVATKKQCRALRRAVREGTVPVVTGYICSTPDGITTTLGRGGSDYSASVLGFALDADEIQIWTDVDGVMTADPRIVPGARVLSQVSYKEAAEMAYFGRPGAASENDGARIRSRHSHSNQEHIRSVQRGHAGFSGIA